MRCEKIKRREGKAEVYISDFLLRSSQPRIHCVSCSKVAQALWQTGTADESSSVLCDGGEIR